MPKDLKEEFLKVRIHKATEELKRVLDKHQLLLSPQLQYMDGGIIPVVKLVERTNMSDEQDLNSSVEAPVEPAVEEAAPQAEVAAE